MPPTPVIDMHVHAFPEAWRRLLPSSSAEQLQKLRGRIRDLLKPWSSAVHRAQTAIRIIPEPLRRPIDALAPIAPLPLLLVESSPSDLGTAMSRSGIHRAVLIAHPPIASNEFVLEACSERPDEWIPAVNIPPETPRPGPALRSLIRKGAKLLKIHPAADGEGQDSPRYRSLLRVAQDEGIPVILHTGVLHSRLLYRDPEQGRPERFESWFRKYPDLRFILAHMNFHDPGVALDLAERYPALRVDTSWQPAEIIGEAVRRLGAEKVLFGSDWPFAGQSMAIGISRITDCVESGFFGQVEADRIRGGNAAELLGIS